MKPSTKSFGVVVDGDGFAGAHGGDAGGGVQGDLVQGGGADAAGYGAVGAEEEFGAQRRGGGGAFVRRCCQRGRSGLRWRGRRVRRRRKRPGVRGRWEEKSAAFQKGSR